MYSVNFIEFCFIIKQRLNHIFTNKCGQSTWFDPDVTVFFSKIVKFLQFERGHNLE